MDGIERVLAWTFGTGGGSVHIDVPQMALRAAVVYLATILIVRMGKKRFMSQASAFDVVLGVMLGSLASRAIAGTAPFLPTLAASAVLVGVHWLGTAAAVRWHGFGTAIKGGPRLLVRDGRIDHGALGAAHMSEHDLWEDLRGEGIADLGEVAEARLERNGKVSVIRSGAAPRVVEVAVAAGVQTVRIELR